MNKTVLKQKAKTGKVKIIIIWTEGDTIYREYGLIGHKMQSTTKTVTGKNIGKSNETTPTEQAELDAKSIITRKIREGYLVEGDFEAKATEVVSELSLDNLPPNFVLTKPINDPPKGVTFSGGYDGLVADRKYNGVCVPLVKTETGVRKAYTRTMRDITDIVVNVIEIQEVLDVMKPGTMLITEFVFTDPVTGRELPRELKGIISDKTSVEKATIRYNELRGRGKHAIKVRIFDIIFNDNEFIGNTDYAERRHIIHVNYWMQLPMTKPNSFKELTPTIIDKAFAAKWEGFVLRYLTGEKSYIGYTLNGKPDRAGAYKFKFEYDDDYVVTAAKYGNGGRLKHKPAKFQLSKYDTSGNLIECCWAGPGSLKTEKEIGNDNANLEDFAKELGIDYYNKDIVPDVNVNVNHTVVLVKFQSKQEGSNALEFPVIQHIRIDKKENECLLADTPRFFNKN